MARANLPFSALSKEDKNFIKECNPEGRESKVYGYLSGKLSEYLEGQELSWEGLFKYSVARQFKELVTPEELDQMDIDREKLIKIELIIALREREFTPEEDMRLDEAICLLNRSPQQRLWNAISCALDAPKIALQRVKLIIKEGKVDVNSTYRKSSFLTKAARVQQNNGLEIIQFLLDHGADIEIAEGQEWTALHVAVAHNNTEVVKLLLERGANANAKDENGLTPLYFAWVQGNSEITELLIDNGVEIDNQPDVGRPCFAMNIQRRRKTYNEAERIVFRRYIDELHL
ncbi:MAG: ankyrin repeat domain-containing protein [Puniceicoccales bacterium]|nr:ankyrin repeat domain-containing protein [Puniceicoccales bacterium]